MTDAPGDGTGGVCLSLIPDPDSFRPSGLIIRETRHRWGSMSPAGPVIADEVPYARPPQRRSSRRMRSTRPAAPRSPVAAAVTEKLGTVGDVQWIDFIVAEPEKPYGVALERIYVDTSVFGACEDEGFREDSRALIGRFRRGEAALMLSDPVLEELEGAPDAVRAHLDSIPAEFVERIEESPRMKRLAAAYIEAGVLPPSCWTDARHIAAATLSEADRIASWNLKHMANPKRAKGYSRVNRGWTKRSKIEVVTPEDMRNEQR